MPHPRVVAIILNFNGGETVLMTLRSLIAGKIRPQIIVVDNASSDESSEKIRRQFPEVNIIKNEVNLGFAGGMNVGIRSALRDGDAQFLWLLNNDCWVDEGALAALLAFASAHPQVGLMSPRIDLPGGEPWFSGGAIDWRRMRAVHRVGEMQYISGCAPLLCRRLAESIRFDERYFLYYEDVAFSLAAQKAGFALALVPSARVVHAAERTGSPEATYWLVRSGLEFFLREASPFWQWWYRIFLPLRYAKNFLVRKLFPQDPIAHVIARAYTDASP